MCVLVKQEDSFIAQNRQQNSSPIKSLGILQLFPVRAEIQLKNLHILAWWGWGYDPSLDICTVDLKSQTHCSSFTQLSHLTAFCTAVLRQQMGCEQIAQAVHFSSSDPSNQGGPRCCRWGSEEGGHCYSVADEIKRPPHPPAALPAMLHTLKVIHYCWIAAQCIPLHFVTLP